MPRKAYASDLTDAQWSLIAPMLPPAKPGGRPCSVDQREVINAIVYLVRTGCQWRMLPHDFPNHNTVSTYHHRYRREGVWHRIHETLRAEVRLDQGRQASPSAAILDSQSVRTTEKGGHVATTQPRGSSGAHVIWSWTAWGCRWR